MSTKLSAKIEPHVSGFIARLRSLKLTPRQLAAVKKQLVADIDSISSVAPKPIPKDPTAAAQRKEQRASARLLWLREHLKIGDTIMIDGNPMHWTVERISYTTKSKQYYLEVRSVEDDTLFQISGVSVSKVLIDGTFLDVYKTAVGAL